jgi:hypothetical protein
VQHGAHFVGRQVDVGLAVIALDKAVAITVAGNSAFKFGEQSGAWAVAVCSCFDNGSLFLR